MSLISYLAVSIELYRPGLLSAGTCSMDNDKTRNDDFFTERKFPSEHVQRWNAQTENGVSSQMIYVLNAYFRKTTDIPW